MTMGFMTCSKVACSRAPAVGHRALFTTARVNELSEDDAAAAHRRQRRTAWKRRKGGAFLDHLVMTVRGGQGGHGCVAFHREKFRAFGPPSGGNGGTGGSVYIMPSHRLTSLAGLSKRVTGGAGGNGLGSWQHGRAGEDGIIYVPYGTVVREVSRGEAEAEAEEEESQERRRARRWVHYPESQDDNVQREAFLEAEARMDKEDGQRCKAALPPLHLEFKGVSEAEKRLKAQEELTRPLGMSTTKGSKGTLVAAGGAGGYGNPHFLTTTNRSPKWATQGQAGDCVTLALELKLIADIGLVGFPNAGKSTLLNALTRRRAKVASYPFTTLNPEVGTVRVFRDGRFDGADGVVEETWLTRERGLAGLQSGVEEAARRRRRRPSDDDNDEVFRFTIADNPGLIANASENVGLGHDFLRSIERARALAYVVDFSLDTPWDDLDILRDELEAYQPGLSAHCRLVIANKADLLVQQPQEVKVVEAAKAKLASLAYLVRERLGPLDVVPVSAKYAQNLRRIVRLLASYVQASRHDDQNESGI